MINKRERLLAILSAVADGRHRRSACQLSLRTVEKHVERLLAKTGLGRRTELLGTPLALSS